MSLLSRLSEPASPRKLALFRIALGLYVAFLYTSASWWLLLEIGGRPNRLTNTALPAPAEAFLDAHLAGPAVVVTGVGAVFLALGACTRIAGWVTFAGFVVSHHYYYRHTHYHDEWPYLWLFLLVMAMAPCADVWSFDAWRRARRSRSKSVAWSLAYRWPIEAMIGWFALVYTAAGIAKLMPLRKGLEWLDGPTVHRLVGMRYFDSPVHWLFGRPAFDYALSWPFTAMALATVVVECGAVVLLFSRRSYPWVYSAIVCMHLVIYLAGVPGFLATSLLSGLLFVPSHWYDAAAQRLATVARAPLLARTARIRHSVPSKMLAASSGRPRGNPG
jgi:hypothetical protein